MFNITDINMEQKFFFWHLLMLFTNIKQLPVCICARCCSPDEKLLTLLLKEDWSDCSHGNTLVTMTMGLSWICYCHSIFKSSLFPSSVFGLRIMEMDILVSMCLSHHSRRKFKSLQYDKNNGKNWTVYWSETLTMIEILMKTEIKQHMKNQTQRVQKTLRYYWVTSGNLSGLAANGGHQHTRDDREAAQSFSHWWKNLQTGRNELH